MASSVSDVGAPATQRQARIVLAVITTSSFFVPFMSAATNVALPFIGQELDIAAPLLSWVNASYMLAATALLLPLGRVADLYSRRHLFVYGILAFALLTALVAVAPSAAVLFTLRAIQGAVGANSSAFSHTPTHHATTRRTPWGLITRAEAQPFAEEEQLQCASKARDEV